MMIYDSDCIKEKAKKIATQHACGVAIEENGNKTSVFIWDILEKHAALAEMIKDIGYFRFVIDKQVDSNDIFENRLLAACKQVRSKSRIGLKQKE